MFTKYINRYQKAEAEWVHEVLDMHGGDQKAAFAALLAVLQPDAELTDFAKVVQACCIANRVWWFDGLKRLKALGVIERVELLSDNEGHIEFYLKANLQPLPAATRDWYRAAGDCECPVCGHPYRLHPEDPDEAPLVVLCDGDRVKL